ncbi:MAG: ATP-dependent DNA helicase [Armatimonadetes bacterium]|nr:ATP-dependent DNA helicase [Armatimonadota bacterium]
MSREGCEFDQKSLRYVLDKHRDADALACDCVGFANAVGGSIVLGMEDGQNDPPPGQRVPEDLPDRLTKRITQITTNVGLVARRVTAANGGEYIHIQVVRNEQGIAATTDGRYFLRVADETRRLMPDDLGRLLTEKNNFVWELQTTQRVPRNRYDLEKLRGFVEHVRASDRVSPFVRNKSEEELLEHYLFVIGRHLTNLGILWIGLREDRAALLNAPVLQCVKYDERGQNVRKQVWAEYELTPMELMEAVWREVPDWRESYELPDGLFRKYVPHYDEVVVRELLANALVHRPYTQRGDIFLNLYPDRLEVHNPGLLPIGVTPRNILHTSSKRNQHLAKVFYDLKLMEGEGSGFDRMYEVLLSSGRPVPEVKEGDDRVVVTVRKRILNPAIVDFVAKADEAYQLTQKERIALGLIAQHESLTAVQMTRLLELRDATELHNWLGRLPELGAVKFKGRTKGKEYFVEPELLRKLEFKGKTTLRGIEKHRLRELVLRDLGIYGESRIGQIRARVGPEIPLPHLRRVLRELTIEGAVRPEGERKGRRYLLTNNLEKTPSVQ